MNVDVASTGGTENLGSGSTLVYGRNAPVGGTYNLSDNARLEFRGSNMNAFNYNPIFNGTGEVLFDGTISADLRMLLFDTVKLTIGTNAMVTGMAGSITLLSAFGANTIVAQKNFDLRPNNSSGALNVGVDPNYKNRTVKTTLQTGTNTLSVNAVKFCGISGISGRNPQLLMDGGTLQVGGGSATALKGLLLTLHDGSLNGGSGLDTQERITVTLGSTANGGLIQVDDRSTFSHVSTYYGNPGALLQLTNTVTLINNGVFTNINTLNTSVYTGLVVEADATLGGSGSFYMAANGTANNAKHAVISGHLSPALSNTVGTLTVTCSNLTWNSSSASASAWTWTLGNDLASDKLLINGNFKKGTGTKFYFDIQDWKRGGTYPLVEWTGVNEGFVGDDFELLNGNGRFSISGKQLLLYVPLQGTVIQVR